jgi:hypothetical protein
MQQDLFPMNVTACPAASQTLASRVKGAISDSHGEPAASSGRLCRPIAVVA